MPNLSLVDTLPPWLLFLVVVGGAISLVCLATTAWRRRAKPPVDESHNDVAGFIFAAVSVLYAVVLAFMVFAVWEAYNAAKEASVNEAAALIAVARDTNSFPEPQRQQMHDLLQSYGETVITVEWPAMGQDPKTYDGSPQAQAILNQMWTVYQSLPRAATDPNTTLFLNGLSEQRAIRLQSNDALPGVFGVALVAGAIFTISFCLVLHMEDVRLHVTMTAILTGMIAVCLWLILELNHPYAGNLAVMPDAFEHALHVIDSLPRG